MMLDMAKLPGVVLNVYGPSLESDLRALDWWHELATSGDMESTYGTAGYVLSQFFQLLRAAAAVWYTTDADGKWNRVAWSGALLGGADFGCWLRPDERQSKESLAFVIAVLRELFSKVETVLSLTTDHRVVGDLQALGFQALEDAIPGLFEGKPVSLLYLQRDAFLGRVNLC